MKFFATTVALAAAVSAEADPQLYLNSSPLLKTLQPATAYNTPVAINQVPWATQYVQTHHIQAPTQYVATKPVHTVEVAKPIEVVQKVESYAVKPKLTYAAQPHVAYTQNAVAYAQPAYTHVQAPALTYTAAQPVAYAAQPLVYAKPQKVYHAKSGSVEHTVISKREAEAEPEPFKYVQYQTGPLSSVKVPTLQKTLAAYGKAPHPVGYTAYQAPAGVYAHQQYAAVPNVYAHQQYAGVPNVYASQYQYAAPTYL